MSAERLFDPPAPEPRAVTLTDRQALVLGWVKTLGPISSDEVGALLHQHKGKHDAGSRCDYCTRDGRGVLMALKAKELVVERRAIGWVVPDAPMPRRHAESLSPESDPFPEGF